MIAKAVIIDDAFKTAVKVEDISHNIKASIWDQAQSVYSGSYIITPAFISQTLHTSGMKMADDVFIDAIILPTMTATASDVFPGKTFIQENGELGIGILQPLEFIETLSTITLTLADTSFPSWAGSTTATLMLASANLGSRQLNVASDTYVIKWQYDCKFSYLDGAVLKAMPIHQCIEAWQVFYKRFSTIANLNDQAMPFATVATQMSAPILEYYTTAGVDSLYVGGTYGVYISVAAATITSSTAATPTITYKRPMIYARCSSTYFSVARKAYVDASKTTIKIKGDLYRFNVSTDIQDAYFDVASIWKNGIV